MSNPTWIFDLDGTLIDSAPVILESLRAALTEIAPERLHMLDAVNIGPPLSTIAAQLIGQERSQQNPAEISRFVDTFRSIYDDAGVRQTSAYPGVTELLQELIQRNQRLIIATNKRGVPTRKLLDLMGWSDYFFWVGCLDESHAPDLGKNSVIASYFKQHASHAQTRHVFVGDTVADALVAQHFAMPFVLAAYGYERDDANWGGVACAARIDHPLELLDIKI